MPCLDAAEIKRNVDIVALVGEYLQLTRRGRVYIGLCPFHDDHSPSLQVDPEHQNFRCWVCQKGGDAITFLQQREGVEFREALGMLAERAGIKLTAGKGQPNSQKQTLYEATAWAEGEFHRYLVKASEAEPAREYLRQRGLTSESAGRFRLGYSPDSWDWLLSRARGTRFTPEVLQRVGLVAARTGSSGYYDWFRGRVLFPVRDVRGRPVAFGGRILPHRQSEKTPKYVNSPETPLFHKSEQLYGLDLARPAIEKTGLAVLVEGYTDCVMAQQHGVGQAIATLGTALTAEQVRLLRRHAGPAGRVVVVFDGDAAGRRAVDRALELFVEQEVDLRLLRLPEGKDPCDLVLEEGGEAFERRLGEAVGVIDFALHRAAERFDLSSINGAYQAVGSILEVLAATPPPAASASPADQLTRESLILDRLAHRFSLPQENLRASLSRMRDQKRRRSGRDAEAQEETVVQRLPSHERELLELVLDRPEVTEQVRREVSPEEITSGPLRALLERCFELSRRGVPPSYAQLTAVVEDPELKRLATQLHEHARLKGNVSQRLEGLIQCLRRRRTSGELRTLQSKLRSALGDEDREVALLREIHERRRTPRAHPA